jgi:hypothetical protein
MTLRCAVAVLVCFIGADLNAQTSPAADAPSPAEEKSDIEAVSPGGAFEIESVLEKSTSASDDVTPDLWIVSTKDRSQRARLPKQSPDSPTDD